VTNFVLRTKMNPNSQALILVKLSTLRTKQKEEPQRICGRLGNLNIRLQWGCLMIWSNYPSNGCYGARWLLQETWKLIYLSGIILSVSNISTNIYQLWQMKLNTAVSSAILQKSTGLNYWFLIFWAVFT
jgi:hypothetical protein